VYLSFLAKISRAEKVEVRFKSRKISGVYFLFLCDA
jgi:hypothetical protein